MKVCGLGLGCEVTTPVILVAVLPAAVAGYMLGRIRPVERLAMWVRWDAMDPPPSMWRQMLVLGALVVLEPVGTVRAFRRARLAPPPPLGPAPRLNPNWPDPPPDQIEPSQTARAEEES